MSTIVQSLISQILGQLAISSFRVVCSLGEGDDGQSTLPWSVTVKDSSGAIVGILSGDQASDVADFLRSPDVANLCQAHFLCRLGQADDYSLDEMQDDIRNAFANLAQSWCSTSDTDWSSLAEDMWSEIEEYMNEALPASEVLARLSSTDMSNFRNQMGADLSKAKSDGGVPKFLRDLINLSHDLTRLDCVRNNVYDIKRHFAEYYAQIRLEHSQYDYRIAIDELYVDRNLRDWESRSQINSSDIFSSYSRSRFVVTGDPGVGKSTFTEYLIWTLAHEERVRNIAPLIINCREYAVTRDTNVFSFLREKLASTLHLRYTDQDIEDILTLGRAHLIVDGVDEILDLGRRRELIRAIEMLASRFPLCPVIATTRNIGYSQAQFNPFTFRRCELRPFNEAQIREYVRRWFSLTARPDTDVERFLDELESIPDLRSNPLMLSLLCILYRARGHIPRNRRQIYSQCADLLFNRWDAMRHIEQPYDHQHYGDELMQEIAIWFYNSQTAQAGLEEQQIRKVIALFLVDTAAVAPAEAQKRAEAFLDFCADRAWLLGSAGTNDKEQRLFVFTHRTFMEFFAAESLARGSNIAKIVSEVAKSYDRDASSVLPDLIVQSAEVHRKGGARDIINGLFELDRTRASADVGHYLPLCLRIINLSPLNPRLMDQIFEKVFHLWGKRPPAGTVLSTSAALDMYRDPRNRFMEALMRDSDCLLKGTCAEHQTHPIVLFLIRWAHLYLSGSASAYYDDWETFIRESVQVTLPYLKTVEESALGHFLIEEGYLQAGTVDYWDLVTRAFDKPVPGYGLRSLYRVLDGNPRDADIRLLDNLSIFALKGKKVETSFAEDLDTCLQDTFQPKRGSISLANADHQAHLSALMLWLGCVAYEARGLSTAFQEFLTTFDFDFFSVLNTREYYLDEIMEKALRSGVGGGFGKRKASTAEPLTREAVKAIAMSRPSWFSRWCYGKISLLRAETSLDE